MTRRSSLFRFVSAVCCGTLIALPLQDGYVSLAAPDAATTLANSLRALQDGESSAPRDHWDPKYVEAQLGNDPARTFAWVRDHTYWIPYHGILRGPVGVLMDRQGDSLDRALLLATMLKDEGQTVRLAHGTIASTRTLSLAVQVGDARLTRVFGRGRLKLVHAAGSPTSALAGRYQLDPAMIQKTLEAHVDTVSRQQQTLRSRLTDQAGRLKTSLGKPADTGARTNVESMMAALADHWWVQTQTGGRWREWDVDAGTIDAALAALDGTADLASLPAALYHQITLRVVAEQWSNGHPHESVVLEHAWRPATTIGQPISLTFAAGAWPPIFPYAGMTVDQSLRKYAADQHEWTPVLEIGKERVQQSAITDAGALTMATGGSDALAVARNATRGLGAAINDAFGAPATPSAAATSASPYLSATWLEYQVDSPGAARKTIRRDVFDLIGPAARATSPGQAPAIDAGATLSRGLALMMTTDILPVVCEISPQYVNHLAAQSLLANRAILTDVVAGRSGDDFKAAQTVSQHLAAGPTTLYGLAIARFALNPSNGLVFVDEPNILTRHQWFAIGGSTLLPKTATDIVAAGVGVDPLVPSPYAMRVSQGVFDTNAEAVLTSLTPNAGDAAWAYDGARDWVALTGPGDPKLASLALSPDVRQRIAVALGSGHLVVAPRAPVTVGGGQFSGWWQIDKRTGETLGMGETGWGQDLPEFAIVLQAIAIGAAKGFIFAFLTCLLAGGGNCMRGGGIGALVGGLTAGLGTGLSVLGGAAGGGGGGLAGGLAGEEAGVGAGVAGEGAGAAGEAGGAAGEGAGAGASGGGGGAGAGGGGAGAGAPATPAGAGGARVPWYRDPAVDELYQKFLQAHLAGDEAAADQYAWERAGLIDDSAEAAGYPRTAQDGLRANGYGLPFDSTGLEDTVPQGAVSPGSPPGTGTLPLGNAGAPAGGSVSPMATTMTSPAATTVPGCALPCTPGGTANLVGLGGAMNALGGGS